MWNAIVVSFQALLLLFFVAVITFAVFLVLLLRNAPKTIDLTFQPPGRTLIYSSDGTMLAKLFVENRKVVPISQIPVDLQNATIAFEDKRFYQHQGVDWKGVGRSLLRNVQNGDLKGQGGSTITQQLARNMGVEGLTREKSIARKWHEWVVATQIEHSYTKQSILEMYLNQVSYGQGTFGVEAAAQTYFGKDVDKLDLAQCALLAGLPNRPTVFNPYHDKKAAQAQRDIVLGNMLAQHFITPQQYAKATAEYIHLAAPKPPKQGGEIYHAPYFVDYVVEQLKKKYGPKALLDGNMQVETSLNWPMQQLADQAVADHIRTGATYGPNQAALVALDPKTGEIKAMVGGVDYDQSQFNIAAHGKRQPGSTFKAVVYSAAIDSGAVTESTRVMDARTVFHLGGKPYIPKDDGRYRDYAVDLREAMAQSINVPAVKVINLIRPSTAVQYARRMGIYSTTHLDPVLSLALGSSPVTPLEMADIYATIASGGNHPVPTPFTRIDDINGKTLEDIPPAVETQVLKSSTVHQVDDMLRAVVTDGTGKVVGDVPDARGKTGTTQGHKDVWFVGYTPQLVCAVWAGHPLHDAKTGRDSYGAELGSDAWGMTICAPIWRSFMLKAVPVYAAARAKEAARSKPGQKAKPPQITNPDAIVKELDATPSSEHRYRRRHRSYDTPIDYTDKNYSPSDSTPSDKNSDATPLPSDNGPSDPDTTPTSPAGDSTPTVTPIPSDNGDTDNTTAGDTPRRRRHHDAPPGDPPHDNVSGTNDHSQPTADGGDSGKSQDAPVRRHAAEPKPKPKPDYVTVRVNPDDGKLATQWTPQSVDRTFVKGTEPHSYSRMYKPPPGEH